MNTLTCPADAEGKLYSPDFGWMRARAEMDVARQNVVCIIHWPSCKSRLKFSLNQIKFTKYFTNFARAELN